MKTCFFGVKYNLKLKNQKCSFKLESLVTFLVGLRLMLMQYHRTNDVTQSDGRTCKDTGNGRSR